MIVNVNGKNKMIFNGNYKNNLNSNIKGALLIMTAPIANPSCIRSSSSGS